jgi:hypothetical protein
MPDKFWETPPGMVCQLLRDLAIRKEHFVDNQILEQAVMAYDLAHLIYLRHRKVGWLPRD